MMTKTKNTLILIAILIILLVIFIFWQNPFKAQQNKTQTETVITNDLTDLQKIEIRQADKTVILTKQENNWLVSSQDNILANEIIIENLIEALQKTKSGTIISSNQDKLANFNLTEDKATRLKLFAEEDNLIIELLIGKRGGPAYDQTYLKKLDSNNILLVEENLTSLVNQPNWQQPEPTQEAELTNINAVPIESNQ